MSRWALPASLLGSITLAVAILALVLGRDELPTATYLVYTSEAQPLPRAGMVETRGSRELRLRFEQVSGELEVEAARGDVAGIVFDEKTFRSTPTDRLAGWRRDGLVLAVFGVDAIAVLDQIDCPTGGSRAPMECDFVLMNGSAGDPLTLDRGRPFLGMLYRDPRSSGEGHTFGWLQADDPELPSWLASWGERAIGARAFVER